MPSRPLFRRHDAASRTRYQELKQLAGVQSRVLSGTPGTLKQRTQSGNQYWVREYIRVDGRKVDEYLGPASTVERKRVTDLGDEIALAKSLAAGSAQLRLLGYQRIDRKPAAVLEVFFNRGLHGAGLALVGSHAYSALLNELGVQAPGYKTEDIDVARSRPLAIALAGGATFQQILKETGLEFVAVPGMPSHRPSATFKLPGAERLAVDLLVPGKDAVRIVGVKELGTYAQAIPLLDFLVKVPIDSVVLSPNQVIPVRVPSPERFLLHKLFSSQSRKATRDKSRKDLEQAAVLAAVVEEDTPGAISDAFQRMPPAGKPMAKRAAGAAAKILQGAHPEASEALQKLAGM